MKSGRWSVLPHDHQGERLVLGTLLAYGELFTRVQELLSASDFSLEKHRRIFACMSELFERGEEINTHSVGLRLHEQKKLESVDGLEYLTSLDATLTADVLLSYAQRLRAISIRARGIQAAWDLIQDLHQADAPAEVLVSAERITNVLTESATRRLKARRMSEIIEDSGGINAFLTPQQRPGIALPRAFADMDATLGGLVGGRYLLVSAMPAVGKTTMVHAWMYYAAAQGCNSLLVTLEMLGKEVMYREILGTAKVSSYRFREGRMGQNERHRVQDKTHRLLELDEKIRIMDQTEASVSGITAVMRSLAANGEPTDLLLVDYLQLVQPDGRKDGNRVTEVTDISRGLKVISQVFEIPVIAICNMNRKGMKPTDEPQLNWLRESGQLEYDANQILFLWPAKPIGSEEVRTVNWRIAKNTYGVVNHGIDGSNDGAAPLRFHTKYCRFLAADEITDAVMPFPVNGHEQSGFYEEYPQ